MNRNQLETPMTVNRSTSNLLICQNYVNDPKNKISARIQERLAKKSEEAIAGVDPREIYLNQEIEYQKQRFNDNFDHNDVITHDDILERLERLSRHTK